MSRRSTTKKSPIAKIIAFIVAVAIIALGGFFIYNSFLAPSGDKLNDAKVTQEAPKQTDTTSQQEAPKQTYTASQEEKEYLANKFKGLLATNSETVGYVYIPGTQLDEPVVQTTDNATYLDKRFDGVIEPLMGAVFMDADNKKDFSDRLTWLFGHARGSKVPDHRMFKDVNYFSRQEYFDEHPYVVIETPERKYYYEAVKVSAKDKYLVLSTCREEDDTIRANLYLRQIPDSEMSDFVKQHGESLKYKPTRE